MKTTSFFHGLWLGLFFALISHVAISQSKQTKEMLVSVPYLTDKNAMIIQESLKKAPGVESIEACYDLHVIVIHYNSETNNEESILETLRTAEINSAVELLYSRDIPAIRKSHSLTPILDNFHRKQ